jgi:predicted ATPase/DNA-binding winged helix-turn-helix (wHTH) protein
MNGSDAGIIAFGPFRLSPSTRVIEKGGMRVALGDRALDILIVLVEQAGKVVSHRELISRVWRDLVVNPSNLRVHMTGLRKALSDGGPDTRYIANVAGQGYCFVAPILREAGPTLAPGPQYPCGTARQRLVLPAMLKRMVGRDSAVRTIAADLITDRFVTIIGPGGMGKTTVAVAVAHALREEFGDAVCFVDIGAVADPSLVVATIASTLGLTVQSSEVFPLLMQCLRSLRVLLVFDNCEHVIDAVATLAEQIYKEAPAVHILATSREALRVEGEHAYWLPPLAGPPREPGLTAAHALTFPAIKLFVERASASGRPFELRDEDAPAIADICARLDGIALAIEFAAGRAGTLGVAMTAELIVKRLGLHWHGRRTAIPRHQTLHALLDWSYGLLAEPERRALRRFSIFVGTFTIAAAQQIAFDESSDESQMMTSLDSLVAKSLLSFVSSGDGTTRYRLLETTRAFALRQLEQSGEAQEIAGRHAQYYESLLNSFGYDIDALQISRAPSRSEHLGNVRASLEWCFGEAQTSSSNARDRSLAVGLAAGTVPLFLGLSLLNECHRWSLAALTLLNDTTRGSTQELVLQEALAISSTWTRGNGEGARAAIDRALELAAILGESTRRLRILVGLHIFLVRIGNIRESLPVAEELARTARGASNSAYRVISDWLLGSSNHFLGNQGIARRHFEGGFMSVVPDNVEVFGLDHRVRALVTFERVLWLTGSADRAMETAKKVIGEAARLSKALDVCFSLVYSVPVFLWCGDLCAAREALRQLTAHPNWRALTSLHATALALQGELLIDEGKAEDGITLLRDAITTLNAERQTLLLTRAVCALAEGLCAAGNREEALKVIDDAIATAGDGSEVLEFPELLRIRANIILSSPDPDETEAERCLNQALCIAQRQSAIAWELKAALQLARLRVRQGRSSDAHRLLTIRYERFTEGFETKDLSAAKLLLDELQKANKLEAHSSALASDSSHQRAIGRNGSSAPMRAMPD